MMINAERARKVFGIVAVALLAAAACAGVVAVAPKAAAEEPLKVTITKTSVPEFGKIHYYAGEVVIEGDVTGMAPYYKAYQKPNKPCWEVCNAEPGIQAMDANQEKALNGQWWPPEEGGSGISTGIIAWDHQCGEDSGHFKLVWTPMGIYGTQSLLNGDEPVYLRVVIACLGADNNYVGASSETLKFYLTKNVDPYARPTKIDIYPESSSSTNVFRIRLVTDNPEKSPEDPVGLGGMPVNVFMSWKGGSGEKMQTFTVHDDGGLIIVPKLPEVSYGKTFYLRAEFDGQGGFLGSHSGQVESKSAEPTPMPTGYAPLQPTTIIPRIAEGKAVLPIFLIPPQMFTQSTNGVGLPSLPGFEAKLAVAGLLAVACLLGVAYVLVQLGRNAKSK
jgi:hypothetical protein